MRELGRLFGREFRKLSVRLGDWLSWLSWHYTWVSVIVLGFIGAVLIFMLCWFFRYDNYEWWRWRHRARVRILVWWITLSVARIILRS